MNVVCPKCGSTDTVRKNIWKAKLLLLLVQVALFPIVLLAATGINSAVIFIALSPLILIVGAIIILKQRGRTWKCNQCKRMFLKK